MVGNAVPSLIAEILATEIRKQLLDSPRRSRTLSLLRPSQGRPPRVEPVRPLDAAYEPLLGDHPDHAGVGLGPRALQRSR